MVEVEFSRRRSRRADGRLGLPPWIPRWSPGHVTVMAAKAPESSPLLTALSPMLAEQVSRPFDDPGWTHEVKYDGYRMLAQVDAGRVTLQTRNGSNATTWFPELLTVLADLPGGRHVLDGEVCVLDDYGRSDFDRLHARAKRRGFPAGRSSCRAIRGTRTACC